MAPVSNENISNNDGCVTAPNAVETTVSFRAIEVSGGAKGFSTNQVEGHAEERLPVADSGAILAAVANNPRSRGRNL
jgi:hypothetical protein